MARLQRQGDVEVRAFVRPGRSQNCPGVELAEGDLANEESIRNALQGVDAVVHAAARVETTGPWEEFAEANIRGTRRLIRLARAAGVKRIVHISSLAIYGVDQDGVTISEDSPYESESNARGHYSRSKLAADRVAVWEAQHGAPVVVLRPGLLYGPGKRPPLARQSFSRGGYKLLLARPEYPLPMTYVDNVADAVWLALTVPGIEGRAYTIVDANVPQREYVALYQAAAEEHWKAVYLPVPAVAAAARLAERILGLARRRSPVTYYQVRRATDRAWFDCTRAHQELGWQPAVDVGEGLRRTFASLRQQPQLDSITA